MALALYDRVQETTTTSGTGSLTLLGAVSGFQSFAVVGNGNTCYYTITDTGVSPIAWEVGIGTYSTSGPTLARTTVLSNSNGNTSPITLSSSATTKAVFLTYPSEKSVNLDASGNVSALGTISSGTWQGTTVAVGYGGTGVTASSGANSVVLRDANQNVTANNFLAGYNVITAAAGTTVLTTSSAYYQRISGSTTQTIQLPDATTMVNGQGFTFDNDASGAVSIVDSASGAIDTVPAGGYSYIFVENNSTSAGSWGKYALIPASYDFSNTTANFGTATITNATWNGGTIGTGYGGTGLTTFTAANYALYSTSSSALTAGTLPVAAGGTGATTLTLNGVLYGTGTTAVGATSAGTTGQVLIATTGSAPSWGSIPTTAAVTSFSAGTTGLTPSSATTGAITLAGTLATGNGGTGLTTFTAANNAIYSTSSSALTAGTLPIAAGGTNSTATPTSGGVGYGTGTAHAYTAAGTSGQALISAGTSAPAFGALAIGTANTNVSGALTPTNGGTGASTLTGYVYGNGTSTMTASTTIPTTALTGNFVSTFSGGTTGLTPSTATAGAITLAGTLAIANGGTGSTTAATVAGTGISVSGTFPNQTVTNAGVTSAVAGTGISVSGATGAVTITNSGVTSIVAGTGISVSGATGAVTVSSTATGATITGTTTNATYYIVGTTSTSGTLSTASISNTNGVSYNASTGALTAVSVVSSSDERLKINWVNLSTDFVSNLADVKHGTFERISSGNREVGVTAQSLKEVLPEAVVEDAEGYMSVNYGAAALVAAIELAKEVRQLRKELDELKGVR